MELENKNTSLNKEVSDLETEINRFKVRNENLEIEKTKSSASNETVNILLKEMEEFVRNII